MDGGHAQIDGSVVADPEWDAFISGVSQWCYKNKMKVRVFPHYFHENVDVEIEKKPMKVKKPGWVKQTEKKAIDRVVWGITDCT